MNRGTPGAPHRVLNAGVPGRASHQVVEELEELLLETRPDACFLTVGHNNAWVAADKDREPAWYDDLRLTKVALLLKQRWGLLRSEVDDAPQQFLATPANTGDGRRWEDRTPQAQTNEVGRDAERIRRRLPVDLASAQRVTEDLGVPLILVSYASDRAYYGVANEVLARYAAEHDLPFIDCTAAAATLTEATAWTDVFYMDGHPRAVGYAVVARSISSWLVSQRLYTGDTRFDAPPSTLWPVRHPTLSLLGSLANDGEDSAEHSDELRVHLTGELPNCALQFYVSPAAPGANARDVPDHWDFIEDPVVQLSLREPGLATHTDERGVAELRLEPLLLQDRISALRGKQVWLGYVATLDPDVALAERRPATHLGTPILVRID